LNDTKRSTFIEKFYIPPPHLERLRSLAKSDAACVNLSEFNSKLNTSISYVVTIQPAHPCNFASIYYSLGVQPLQGGPSPDLALCALYELRRQGKRKKNEILAGFDKVRQTCISRLAVIK